MPPRFLDVHVTQVDGHPDLAGRGSWHGTEASYSREDLRTIVQHAERRGVRVIPEIDVPGHAYR